MEDNQSGSGGDRSSYTVKSGTANNNNLANQHISSSNSGSNPNNQELFTDDDSLTVVEEMLKRVESDQTSSKDGASNHSERPTTEAIAGNLVGYQMLKMVHGNETPDYEKLRLYEMDLQKVREIAENLILHPITHSFSQEPRPTEANILSSD
jgi:hypothetical protein